ncbi:MAG: hypothetical protein ACE37I_08685 [Rubinisphaera brasiliensis]|uniref:Lipoprotein n=1 Tax=Rubinisphaera brasiliensis (strain ATCC 49424 / DSM 5305 / JCM 21570 / IAM 15109 / NBRC 103401 / IFAM 1448) TaxID=756272 RepID=F0SKF4_RUBBR|nr:MULTISPECIES: hypothetical protein [Rubinisphaera]ADY61935.1 hypothetical protein Plabr_4362 [Rubinisphaera brasiliensis DSM 5305]
MKSSVRLHRGLCAVLLAVAGSSVLTGCQTQIGGQTLPSAFYLRDDVQYFPSGPEELLPNQERALAEYRAEQKALKEGVDAR